MNNDLEALSAKETKKYLELVKSGDMDARDIVINHNTKLVKYIVNKHFMNTSYDFDDLVSIGYLGLINAVDTYVLDKKTSFSTYAGVCIKNQILMFLRKKRVDTIEIDATISNNNDEDKVLKLSDILKDDKYDFSEHFDDKEMIDDVKNVFEILTDREKLIIKLAFGLTDNGKVYSQKQISKICNISKALTSRIIANCLKKMKTELIEIGIIDGSKQLTTIYNLLGRKSLKFESKINQVIYSLNYDDTKLLELRYGNDLKNPISSPLFTPKKRYEFYCRLLPKIKEMLNNEKESEKIMKDMNIYEILKESKEKIDKIISMLSEEEKRLIKARYGDDLENPICDPSFSQKDRIAFYSTLVPKMKNMLANFENTISSSENSNSNEDIEQDTSSLEQENVNLENATLDKKPKNKHYKNGKMKKNIYDLLENYSKEDIDKVIEVLSDEEKDLIKARYDDHSDFNDEQFYNFYKLLLPKMKRALRNHDINSKGKTIYAVFNRFPKEAVDEVIQKLNAEDKKLLEARYGSNFEKPIKCNISRGESYQLYNILIPKITKMLFNNYEASNLGGIYTVLKKYSKEDIDKVIETLSDEEKKLLKIKYGDDLNDKTLMQIDKNLNHQLNNNIIPKIKKRLTNSNNGRPKTIYSTFNNYSKEDVDKVINTLDDNEKELLKARYGDDLEHPVLACLSGPQHYRFYGCLMPKIKSMLDGTFTDKKTKKIKTIYQFCNGYSKEDVDKVIESLNDNEKELLKARYGDDLEHPICTKITTKQLQRFYDTLVPKIKKLLSKLHNENSGPITGDVITKEETIQVPVKNKSNKDISKEDYIKILEMLKKPTFNQMVETLDTKSAIIISLRLGYVDNKYFSSKSIAEFLGVSEEEVIETTKNVLICYKNSINEFIDKAIKSINDQPKLK